MGIISTRPWVWWRERGWLFWNSHWSSFIAFLHLENRQKEAKSCVIGLISLWLLELHSPQSIRDLTFYRHMTGHRTSTTAVFHLSERKKGHCSLQLFWCVLSHTSVLSAWAAGQISFLSTLSRLQGPKANQLVPINCIGLLIGIGMILVADFKLSVLS